MSDLRKAHRLLAPRIAYLIGTLSPLDGTKNIIPVSNVTSISTAPQQIVVAVFKEWQTHRALLEATGFTLSAPHIDQLEGVWKLGAKYSRYPYRSNAEKISGSGLVIDDAASEYGPVLAEGVGWLGVRTLGRLDFGGDHTSFVGQIEIAYFNPGYLDSEGIPRGDVYPVMQATGNMFTTAAEPRTIPYYT